MSSLQAKSERAVSVSWQVEMEIHHRETFQKEGHFVCGLKNENGDSRPWEGELLYVLTLWHMKGPQKWEHGTASNLGEGLNDPIQVLRVMADSPEAADVLMADGIRANLNAYAMLLGVNTSYMNQTVQLRKDFEAVKTKLNEVAGPDAAVNTIREARIREYVG